MPKQRLAPLALALAVANGAQAASITPPNLISASGASNGDLMLIWPTAAGGPLESVSWANLKAQIQADLGSTWLKSANNLSDLTNTTAARTNLELDAPWQTISMATGTGTYNLCDPSITSDNLLATIPGGNTITNLGTCPSGTRKRIRNAGAAGTTSIPFLLDGVHIIAYQPQSAATFAPGYAYLPLQPGEDVDAISLGGGAWLLTNYDAASIWNYGQIFGSANNTAAPATNEVCAGPKVGAGPVPYKPFCVQFQPQTGKGWAAGWRYMLPGDTPNVVYIQANANGDGSPIPWTSLTSNFYRGAHDGAQPLIDIGPDASGTGSIAPGSIPFTGVATLGAPTGTWAAGQILSGTGVTVGTAIQTQLSGATGGAGTYLVAPSQTASSTTITAKLYGFPNNATTGVGCFNQSPSAGCQGYSADHAWFIDQIPSLTGTGGGQEWNATPDGYETPFQRMVLASNGGLNVTGMAAFEACHSPYPYNALTILETFSPCGDVDDTTKLPGNLNLIATDYTDSLAHNFAALTLRQYGAHNEGLDIGMKSSTGTDVMTVHSGTRTVVEHFDPATSQVTMPVQSAAYAYVGTSLTNVTGDGTVANPVFNTVDYDRHADYSTSTGKFTAPVGGIYACYFDYVLTSYSQSTFTKAVGYMVVSTGGAWGVTTGNPKQDSSNQVSLEGQSNILLAAGATVQLALEVDGGTKTVGINGGFAASAFSCRLAA